MSGNYKVLHNGCYIISKFQNADIGKFKWTYISLKLWAGATSLILNFCPVGIIYSITTVPLFFG